MEGLIALSITAQWVMYQILLSTWKDCWYALQAKTGEGNTQTSVLFWGDACPV